MPFVVQVPEDPPDMCSSDYSDDMERWRAVACNEGMWIRTDADLLAWIVEPAKQPQFRALSKEEIDAINARAGSGPG